MTTPDDIDTHDLSADPADDLMARFADLMVAADALHKTALDIQCPGCDPTGEQCDAVREQMLERFNLSEIDADLMLGRMADLRTVLLGVLTEPCRHDHGEQHGE